MSRRKPCPPALAILLTCLALFPASLARADAPSAEPERPQWLRDMVALPDDNIAAALADESRSAEDRARDAAEKGEAILRAAAVTRGMRAGDLRAGDGHFTQLLMLATYRFGRIWANNDPASLSPAVAEAWTRRLEDPSTADIARLDDPLVSAMPVYTWPLDVVFSRHAVHDAVTRGLDRAAMHAAVMGVLAPKGRYVLVDSRAADGAAAGEAARLCRAVEADVKKEVEAAGFLFLSASDALGEADDDRATSACSGGAGRDRFLLVFEKPEDRKGAPPWPGR